MERQDRAHVFRSDLELRGQGGDLAIEDFGEGQQVVALVLQHASDRADPVGAQQLAGAEFLDRLSDDAPCVHEDTP